MWQFCVRRNELLTEGFPKTVFLRKITFVTVASMLLSHFNLLIAQHDSDEMPLVNDHLPC